MSTFNCSLSVCTLSFIRINFEVQYLTKYKHYKIFIHCIIIYHSGYFHFQICSSGHVLAWVHYLVHLVINCKSWWFLNWFHCRFIWWSSSVESGFPYELEFFDFSETQVLGEGLSKHYHHSTQRLQWNNSAQKECWMFESPGWHVLNNLKNYNEAQPFNFSNIRAWNFHDSYQFLDLKFPWRQEEPFPFLRNVEGLFFFLMDNYGFM